MHHTMHDLHASDAAYRFTKRKHLRIAVDTHREELRNRGCRMNAATILSMVESSTTESTMMLCGICYSRVSSRFILISNFVTHFLGIFVLAFREVVFLIFSTYDVVLVSSTQKLMPTRGTCKFMY